jgi:type IV secretion system T-DNA border endonuclease VirD2
LSEADEQRLVQQVNARLTPEAIRDLRSGNAEVLEGISSNPREQLELAKAWLQANKVAAGDPAMEKVLDGLVQDRHGDRLREDKPHGEKGMRHG